MQIACSMREIKHVLLLETNQLVSYSRTSALLGRIPPRCS